MERRVTEVAGIDAGMPDPVSALALRAGAGDRSALAGLIEATQRDVWRYLAFHAGVGEADDLTQETFLRALGTLSRFEGRSSFRTWILVIARRVLIDELRRRRSRPSTVSSDAWPDQADHRVAAHGGVSTGLAEMVEWETLLRDLGPDRREALVLTQVLGLSYQEVADICGCPIGTVRSRVARARDDLIRWSRADDVAGAVG